MVPVPVGNKELYCPRSVLRDCFLNSNEDNIQELDPVDWANDSSLLSYFVWSTRHWTMAVITGGLMTFLLTLAIIFSRAQRYEYRELREEDASSSLFFAMTKIGEEQLL